jgi:hypothetical protein
MNLKNALITLSSIAGVLALVSFYVVFYANTGTYVVNSDNASNTVFSTSTISLASSTTSSTLSLDSSSTASSTSNASSSNPTGQFISNYSTPPITWSEGNEAMAITNATLSGSQLTLELQIVMGTASECVPLNIKIITDENGDLAPPVNPQFTFPDSGTCKGTAGETYTDQQVVFTVDSSALPLILNTGGVSNILFEIDTTPEGGLTIELPPSSG